MRAPWLRCALLSTLAPLMAAGACATTAGGRPGVHEHQDARAVRLEPLRFDEDGLFAYVDGRTGATLTFADVAARAVGAELVVVGEQHDKPSHHDLERRVIEAVAGAHRGTVVGLEMVTWPGQEALDRFSSGGLDADAFAAAVDWKKTWGHDFELYRPILEAARAAGARLLALNAPRDLVHAVATEGLEKLTAQQTAQLPELDMSDDTHRLQLRAMFGDHTGKGPTGAGGFERFYTAQVVWDESMADGAARALLGGAPAVVVLAGNGHVAGGHGIPQRALRRRPGTRLLTIVPVELDDDASPEDTAREAIARGDGDVLAVRRPTEALRL